MSSKSESYANVKTQENFEFSNETIRDRIITMARLYPDHVPFVFEQNGISNLTWADLKRRVEVMAQNLLSLGFKKSDRLAFCFPNTIESIITMLACSYIGVISTPFHPRDEIEYMIEKSNPKGLVLMTSFDSIFYFRLLKKMCPEILKCDAKGEFVSEKFKNLTHVFVAKSLENLELVQDTELDCSNLWDFKEIYEENAELSFNKIQLPILNPHDLSFLLFTVFNFDLFINSTMSNYQNFIKHEIIKIIMLINNCVINLV